MGGLRQCLEWSEGTTEGVNDFGTLSYINLGSQLNAFAIAFTIETTDTGFFASDTSPSSQRLEIFNEGSYETTSGRISITVRNGNDFTSYSDTDVTHDPRYRVSFRIIDINDNNAELYVTKGGGSSSSSESNTARSQNPINFADFTEEIDLGRRASDSAHVSADWDALIYGITILVVMKQ